MNRALGTLRWLRRAGFVLMVMAACLQSTSALEEASRPEKAMNDRVVQLLLLHRYAPLWLAGILGAGIMAAVMASDSQILALSTMFTEDVFAFYGGRRRFGERTQVQTGRIFIIVLTALAYAVALRAPETIFEIAIQYAFSGFAAMSPLMIAALFWRGSTKWGALASTVWVALAVTAVAVFQLDLDFRGMDALGVLVQLGPAGAPADGGHLRNLQQ